jgi:anaerobic ribonucleoside-triphosphate reductase
MAEIIIVGCTGACLTALTFKFIEENQEIKKNIEEYIRLDLEIFEKQKKIKKKKENEIKELEQKFIYEYPNYSLFTRKNLSRKIVEIKYQWQDDDDINDINNMSFELNNIRMKLSSIDNMRINNILFEVNNIRHKYKLEQKI